MKTIRIFRQTIRLVSCLVLVSGLVLSSSAGASAAIESSGLSAQEDLFLDELAKDTWNYLHSDWATDNHLPWSWRAGSVMQGDYANVTEIGFYALSWIAAYDIQRTWSPDWTTTEAEVTAVLSQLQAWQTGSQAYQPHGPNAYQKKVFYQSYWINWPSPVVGDNSGQNHVVPSIDNAWLAASLITIREYAQENNHPALAEKANAILSSMDFTLWYHFNSHLFSWGDIENPQGGSLAGVFSDENRIINFVAHALGQLSDSEFQSSLDALAKTSGSYSGISVARKAWDGSYFTYTGPALFIREMDTSYGLNTILPATRAQIQYAGDQHYAAWGLSDGFDIALGEYIQQGAPPVAMPGLPPCPPGYTPNSYECAPGLVAPYASALALITTLAPQAIANLQHLSSTFSCDDPSYGFRDSVMTKAGVNYGNCSDRFSALDQEWIFLSIINHENGFLWNYFYKDSNVVDTHAKMYVSKKAADTTGVFRPGNGLLYLKNKNETGFADAALNYGLGGDYPVVGDWDGNGTTTIGVYRNGTFYLRNENTIGFAEVVFPFGTPGDQPVAGDWNGDGVDTIGVYRPYNGEFMLRNSNDEGPAEMSFYLGNVGDMGIAGDWDGNGVDTTGVFRPSNGLIFLKNKNSTGIADIALNYGLPGDLPVTGDWNNDGVDSIGVYRSGTFYLRNENTIGFAEIIFGLGNPGDMPIAGDWDALP